MKEMLMLQLDVTHRIFKVNTDGISHEESLQKPGEVGNCINWIGGHLITAYNSLLTTLGQEKVWSDDRLEVYKRGAEPLSDPSRAEAFAEICDAFSAAHERLIQGLEALPPERLSEPAPYSPGNNPEETLGSLLQVTAFHQAYHVGQLGLARRLVGKAGAVK